MRILLPVLTALLVAAASAAQGVPAESAGEVAGWELAPRVAAVAIEAGFADDPFVVEVGLQNVQPNPLSGAGCVGYLGTRPDVVVRYRAGAAPLTISATGGDDLALVVRAPDGTYHCDDDSGRGFDPALTLEAPLSGEYRVWAGVYDVGSEGERAEIGFSERGVVLSAGGAGSGAEPPGAVGQPPPPPPPPPEPSRPTAEEAAERERREREARERQRREEERRTREPQAPDGTWFAFRYPSIESPEAVDPGQAFTVLVSLAELRDAATVVVQGDTTDGGALRLAAPAAEGDRYSVVVHAAGFAVEDDEQPLVLFPDGDSTPARFRLTADADTPPGTPREIHATLWTADGAYMGRFKREVRVGVEAAARAASSASTGARAPELTRIAEAVERPLPPDLTVETIYGLDPNRPRRARVTVRAGVQRFGSTWWDEPEGAQAWVEAQLGRLAALGGRGTDEEAPDPARAAATAEGVGAELWDRYAPPLVRDAFWALVDAAGGRFAAIQFVTNDAALPWELMRPSRAGEARGFLGAEFDVSRWHDGELSPRRAPWAPQRVGVDEIAVVAPSYEGPLALPAAVREKLALADLARTRPVGGAFADVRQFLETPSQAVLHFAGHGRVEGAAGGYAQAIVLEDGDLDLAQVRGLLLRAERAPPFVFFNACEVGQSDAAGGFVTGWGPTMLDAGTAGYVGPLWPVGDAAAAAFSERFYRALLDHGHVARALREARQALYDETGDVTALAYVYYGDPLQRVEIDG